MKYSQITVKTTTEASEIVAYFLQEVCLDGVGIYDPRDLNESSWDYVDESAKSVYSDEVEVKGYCSKENTDSVLCFLRKSFENIEGVNVGSLQTEVCEVDGDAWVNEWKRFFTTIDIGNIVICPEWITPDDKQKHKKVLKLETGVSFGTGQHETTSMCVELMQKFALKGKSVLDVGCGSGILGLCALLLGARNATLTDIDAQATEVAQSNAKLNLLQRECKVIQTGLTEGVEGKFDVVFANLTADILYLLAEVIDKSVKSGSKVILSGILNDRADRVIAAFEKKGMRLIEKLSRGEWTALLMEC
ncbi:MAG: 50S ribosomal protein L11 methyltransferase [Corallococcus sp.]|nr:50S ribosomal protein L11 methyltransferase [Corallococcus sp.]